MLLAPSMIIYQIEKFCQSINQFSWKIISERYNLTSSSENFNLDSKPSLLKSNLMGNFDFRKVRQNLTGILEALVTWQICGQAENPNNILTVLICPDFNYI